MTSDAKERPAPSSPQSDDAAVRLEWICVFCGSTAGEDPRYLDGATLLGQSLAGRGIGLVYGGSQMGLMGRIADSVLDAGGKVVGVLPEPLQHREVAHRSLTELVITGSMHERKAEMARRADGFIAAPGGLGTIEEFLEVLTWAQLGMHRKPCGILNTNGYFDPLAAVFDHALREGFIQTVHREMILSDSDAEGLLDRMQSFRPPRLPRWIEVGET